jgi:hypothetical protein
VPIIVGSVGVVMFIVVCIVLLRVAFSSSAAAEIPDKQWKVQEVAGRCKALFPSTPTQKSQALPGGLSLVMHMAEYSKDSVFGFGYTEGALPPHRLALPAETILNDSCNGSVANAASMGGKEVSRESITLGDYPGKQLVIHIPQAKGHMISRCFLANGRLYMVLCGGTGYDPGHRDVKRFLDSFEILDKSPAPVLWPRPDDPPPRTSKLPPPPRTRPRPAPENPRDPPVIAPRKEPEPPPAARLELPPLPAPLEISPPAVKAETPYKLPEAARALRVGGGGRFLILHLPEARKFGVFDVNEAKIVRYIPAAEDEVLFAAGMTKLLVFLPGARLIQRYNLLTGEREQIGKLDLPDGKIEAFCLGYASAGPLLVSVANHGAQLFEIEKFRPITLPADNRPGREGGPRPLEGGLYWAGATGRVFGHTGNYGMPNGVKTLVLDSGVEEYGEHQGTWFVVPGPDDRHVYAGGHGVVSNQVKRVDDVPFSMGPGSGFASHLYLPAAHGPYYLHAQTIEDFGRGDKTPVGTVRIYMFGSKEPIATYSNTAVAKYGWDGLRGFGIENSIHLIPRAKLLVIVPGSRDELRLYPADLDAALDKSGRDYLLFTSTPAGQFRKGKEFTYRAEVKAKKRPVKFKLDGAPKDMTIDADGVVSWRVPADFMETRVHVILTATDAGGQEAFQTLTLTEVTD